jgi:hypothetical protein
MSQKTRKMWERIAEKLEVIRKWTKMKEGKVK